MNRKNNAKSAILGKELKSYSRGLIETGLSRLAKEAINELLPHQGSIQEHIRLLKSVNKSCKD
jgi:hypothetical protein